MMKVRKGNRKRDLVGAIVFVVAAALLWVEAHAAGGVRGSEFDNGSAVVEAASIRSADGVPMGRT